MSTVGCAPAQLMKWQSRFQGSLEYRVSTSKPRYGRSFDHSSWTLARGTPLAIDTWILQILQQQSSFQYLKRSFSYVKLLEQEKEAKEYEYFRENATGRCCETKEKVISQQECHHCFLYVNALRCQLFILGKQEKWWTISVCQQLFLITYAPVYSSLEKACRLYEK